MKVEASLTLKNPLNSQEVTDPSLLDPLMLFDINRSGHTNKEVKVELKPSQIKHYCSKDLIKTQLPRNKIRETNTQKTLIDQQNTQFF